jgi:hypothetical protein
LLMGVIHARSYFIASALAVKFYYLSNTVAALFHWKNKDSLETEEKSQWSVANNPLCSC